MADALHAALPESDFRDHLSAEALLGTLRRMATGAHVARLLEQWNDDVVRVRRRRHAGRPRDACARRGDLTALRVGSLWRPYVRARMQFYLEIWQALLEPQRGGDAAAPSSAWASVIARVRTMVGDAAAHVVHATVADTAQALALYMRR